MFFLQMSAYIQDRENNLQNFYYKKKFKIISVLIIRKIITFLYLRIYNKNLEDYFLYPEYKHSLKKKIEE
jgi:hypothetical protein